uniref:Cysteine-rich DPF motif domain-containing protein 1 n=1 Tax=Chelonoidis abingdonii TaxID=106734 RepID=A0A8C0G610_CHEAB
MDSHKDAQPKGDFECQLCGLTAPYSYYGQKPPNTHSVVLLEECYVMKDPFVPDKDKFLILGSQCSLCNRRVCAGTVSNVIHGAFFCFFSPGPVLRGSKQVAQASYSAQGGGPQALAFCHGPQ